MLEKLHLNIKLSRAFCQMPVKHLQNLAQQFLSHSNTHQEKRDSPDLTFFHFRHEYLSTLSFLKQKLNAINHVPLFRTAD